MSGVTVMAVVVASCSSSSGSGWGGSAATTSSAHMPAPTTSAQPLKLLRPLKPLKQPSARRGAPDANATLVRFNTADGISLDGAMVGTGTVGVVMTHEYDNDLCGAWPFANYPAKRACASSPLMCAASAALSVPRATPPAGWSTTSSPPSLSCARRGVTRVALVGASMGGSTALIAARRVEPPVDAVASYRARRNRPACFVFRSTAVAPSSSSPSRRCSWSPTTTRTPPLTRRV